MKLTHDEMCEAWKRTCEHYHTENGEGMGVAIYEMNHVAIVSAKCFLWFLEMNELYGESE